MEGNDISISTVASEMVVGDRELLDKKIAAIRSTGHQKLQVFLAFIMVKFWIIQKPNNVQFLMLKLNNLNQTFKN